MHTRRVSGTLSDQPAGYLQPQPGGERSNRCILRCELFTPHSLYVPRFTFARASRCAMQYIMGVSGIAVTNSIFTTAMRITPGPLHYDYSPEPRLRTCPCVRSAATLHFFKLRILIGTVTKNPKSQLFLGPRILQKSPRTSNLINFATVLNKFHQQLTISITFDQIRTVFRQNSSSLGQ